MTNDLGTHIKQQLGNLKAFGVLDYIENLEKENEELKYALSSSMTEQGFLENEIKNFKSGAEYKALADMVDSLQKENAELKAHCKAVDEVNEKMKCCGNCKHFRFPVNVCFAHGYVWHTFEDTVSCGKWELAE